MRENIENMVRQASMLLPAKGLGPLYKGSLKDLIDNLKKVRDAHLKGDSKKVLDAFFEHYVFSDNQQFITNHYSRPVKMRENIVWDTNHKCKQ